MLTDKHVCSQWKASNVCSYKTFPCSYPLKTIQGKEQLKPEDKPKWPWGFFVKNAHAQPSSCLRQCNYMTLILLFLVWPCALFETVQSNAVIFLSLRLKDDRSGLVVMPDFSKDSLCRRFGHSQRHPPGIYSRVPPDAVNCIKLGHIKAYFHNMDSCSTDLQWLSLGSWWVLWLLQSLEGTRKIVIDLLT